eukprot:11198787-Lingulodinium_polyedra.AAC.1
MANAPHQTCGIEIVPNRATEIHRAPAPRATMEHQPRGPGFRAQPGRHGALHLATGRLLFSNGPGSVSLRVCQNCLV